MYAIRMALLLLPLGILAGCSGGPATGDVSGTVSYDGKPIEQGSITFYPADGNGPVTGDSIKDGKYSVAKVPIGTAKVVISGAKDSVKRKMDYDNPKAQLVQTSSELLPEKYNKSSMLRFDVEKGSQTKDFNLEK